MPVAGRKFNFKSLIDQMQLGGGAVSYLSPCPEV